MTEQEQETWSSWRPDLLDVPENPLTSALHACKKEPKSLNQ